VTDQQAGLVAKARRAVENARAQMEHGDYDFATSRAYYAMFYVAEAFLLEKGLAFPKHSAVIAAFGQHFVKTGMVAAEFQRYLTEGQAARNISDYDIGPAVTAADASQQISRAQEFLELADRLLGSPPIPSGQGG
jgi:uncharacterized protein (UPF0332 family)